MDDIYFWILRVWGALTSRKGIVVGLVGVAAVVVTVTSVIAAPLNNGQNGQQEETNPDVFVSMEPPEVTNGSFLSSGVLDPREELSIGGVSSPGMLPTSPFFFLKDVGREVRYAFSFDQIDRAYLKLRYANEDLLAIREMLMEEEYLSAAQQCHSYQANFFASLTWAVHLKKQGHDVDAYVMDIVASHEGHRLVLAEALEVVDESWREAFMGAVTHTSAPLEQVIEWTMGPDEAAAFQTKLANDFSSVDSDVWLQIDNLLGLDVEQATVLREAMGEDSTVGAAPIISSVTADSFELAPGAVASITCSASDLAGGELSYEWLADEGSLDGSGDATVKWTAPEEFGLYTVTVIVSDERGNDSRKSVNLRVGDPEPEDPAPDADGTFWIEEITAERDPSGRAAIDNLPPGTERWDWSNLRRNVYVGSTIRITCVTGGGNGNLTYEWSANGGEVLGSGDSVVWVAPNHPSEAQVTLEVRDSSGATETATLRFRMSTCALCFNPPPSSG